VAVVSATFLLAVATTTRAQTYTPLFNFNGSEPSDLTLSGSNFYGTTTYGGGHSDGMVFQIVTNGTGFTPLYSFSGGNDDGSNPRGAPMLSGSTLYGTTSSGGNSYGDGTVFEINTNGTNYAILYSFVPWEGQSPYGALAVSGTKLFGVTTAGNGALFSINSNGSGFTNLHVFGGSITSIVGSVTNVFFLDGTSPNGSLALSGSTLYGTTTYGGTNNYGTVFSINTDGSGYSILHNFSSEPGDGYNPYSPLILSGSTLYGTTAGGGRSNGTVFQINTNGTGFAVLYGFGLVAADGYAPYGPLTLSGSTLYGTTTYGGSNSYGTVFQINTDGTGYQILYNFLSSNSGNPNGSLILADSTLCGIAGNFLFSLTVPTPPITPTSSPFYVTSIVPQGYDILITWTSGIGSTNALQATAGDASGGYNTNNFADIFIVTNTVGAVTNYLDAGALTNFTSRYYRVQLVP
jgi:uncharacterized repeat protein (TIGR03803 family)